MRHCERRPDPVQSRRISPAPRTNAVAGAVVSDQSTKEQFRLNARQPAPTAPPRRTSVLALLVIVLLLAFALRIHAAGERSFWADEGWTMLLSEGPGADTITRTLADDQHPPLYFLLLRGWRSLAGDTEFATRSLGILAGVVAVAAIFQLGRALYSIQAGLLAALLLALADLHIDLSQETRHYGLMTTWAVVASLFYARWWHAPTRANRVGYVLSGIALLYTHYLGGFVLIAHLLHMLIAVRPRSRLAEALFLFGSICLGFLPWLPVVVNQNRVRWTNPLYYQNALANSADTVRAVRTALLGEYYVVVGALLLLGLIAVVYRRQARRTTPPAVTVRLRPLWPTLLLVIWIGLMVATTFALNARHEFLTVRNFVIVVPPLMVLAARGLTNLEPVARLFMIGVLVTVGLGTVDVRREYPDWRAVTRNVTQYHLPGEPILMDIWVGDFPTRYYVTRQMGADTPRISLREWRDTYGTQFLPQLLGYLQGQDAFWLIKWGADPLDEYGALIAEAGFQRTARLSVDHRGTPLVSDRFDRVPAGALARFGELFALHKVHLPAAAAPGTVMPVALWWSAQQPPPLDYSISVFLLDADGVQVAQHDAPPLEGRAPPTSRWQPGDPQFDYHALIVPAGLVPGQYEVGVRVYWYGDGVPLNVNQPGAAGDARRTLDYARLGMLAIR